MSQLSFLAMGQKGKHLKCERFLEEMNKVIPWTQLCQVIEPHYQPASTGRPLKQMELMVRIHCLQQWYHPLLFKMIFLQFLYDISDREIEEQVRYNIAYKWFVGLNAEELPPDHSTLSVFRDRLGASLFQQIFNWIVSEAKGKGFVNEQLHIIDSTDIEAKGDIVKWNTQKRKEKENGRNDDEGDVSGSPPDKDARWGYEKRDKPFFGFKFHGGMDADSEILVRCDVTSGNEHDVKSFFKVMNGKAKGVCEDKGYDAWYIHYLLAGFRIRDGIYRKMRRNRSVRERSWIERKFAECKHRHGLERARYWGLEKLKRDT